VKAKAYIHCATGLRVMIEPDVSDGFIAWVPRVPGCVSQGEDEIEARQNIDDALRAVLDVMRAEDPTGTERILAGSDPAPTWAMAPEEETSASGIHWAEDESIDDAEQRPRQIVAEVRGGWGLRGVTRRQ